ncbi:MAG: aminotransferase class V-fold PLP-dependent enzyme [Bacteroidota bacterium]
MLNCQKEKFTLDPDYTYLNCAYMSPNLKSVEAAGIQGVKAKSTPYHFSKDDFFTPVQEVRELFARLINAREPGRVAIVPSTSYGMANVANNIHPKNKTNLVLPGETFPSNYYVWERFAERHQLQIRTVPRPKMANAAIAWNDALLEAIDEGTALLTLGQVHWADGTLFDLPALREKTTSCGAHMIIDGTQSIGALPFDVQAIRPDALVCASYKYMMAPYGIGMAWYGPAFDDGVPIEDNWINRLHSDDFQNLVNYQSQYQGFASRYSVGEQSNFILIPMLREALLQLLEWTPNRVQEYCASISKAAVSELQAMGCSIESATNRGHHLFGIRPPAGFDMEKLKAELAEQRILVSLRGDAIRVAPNVYNDADDFARLCQSLHKVCSASILS